MGRMEEALARQMAGVKVTDERRKREIEKLCGESDELKELQTKIKAAYLNKERSQQMTEKQFRTQIDIVSLTNIQHHNQYQLTYNITFIIHRIGTRRPDRRDHAKE